MSFYLYASGESPGTKLSDINRTYDVGIKKLVRQHRLANGSLRQDVIAVKRTFTLSWKTLPSLDADVADSGMGVESIEAIVNATGAKVLKVPDDEASYDLYDVLVTADPLSKKLALRFVGSGKQYWDVTLTLEEL